MFLWLKLYYFELKDFLYKIIKKFKDFKGVWEMIKVEWVFLKVKLFYYVLKYINCEVKLGEVMVVVGLSGVGKFILFEVLVGRIKFGLGFGSIFVNG